MNEYDFVSIGAKRLGDEAVSAMACEADTYFRLNPSTFPYVKPATLFLMV